MVNVGICEKSSVDSGRKQNSFNKLLSSCHLLADRTLLTTLVVFTVAYCVQPLLVDALKYQGAAEASTLLYLVPHYLAMASIVFLPSTGSHQFYSGRAWKKAFIVSLIDAAHQVTEKLGLIFAGSAVYIIIGSSSIVWTALISATILRTPFTKLQWLSLLIVCLGLCIKAGGMPFECHSEEFLGVMFTVGSAFLHGLTFVTNEKFLTTEESISGPTLVVMMGVINSTLLFLWSCIWTIPRYEKLIVQSIASHEGSYSAIAVLLGALFLCGLVHSTSLWYLLKRIGAVSSGVIKGFKTASVFVLSHVFFCHIQESQCLNTTKAFSAAICVSGVLMYSIVTSIIHRKVEYSEKTALCSKENPSYLSTGEAPASRTFVHRTSSSIKIIDNNSNV